MQTNERGVPTWIATGDGYLAGWVHAPADGMVKGSVVLAPATDREQVISFRAWHVMALELARAGFVAVRFAFRGDGDSDALTGDDVVGQWQQDLDAAISLAQRLFPAAPTTVVGLRLGAAVAGCSTNSAIGQRILWEPISGKQYLRAQSALRRVSVVAEPMSSDETVELPGECYSLAQAASIRELPAPRSGEVRKERDRRVAELLYSSHTYLAAVPRESIREIIEGLPTQPAVRLAEWTPAESSVRSVGGVRVVERFVTVGPHGLAGVISEPADGKVVGALLWCSAGSDPKDGPTGLWADLAKEYAALGVRSLRFDRRGAGDALDPSADTEPSPYRESAVDDTVEGIRLVQSMTEGPVWGVGLSAGGWLCARASEVEPLARIVLFNNMGWHRAARKYDHIYQPSGLRKLIRSHSDLPGDERQEAPVAEGAEVAKPRGLTKRLASTAAHLAQRARARMPLPVYRVVATSGLLMDPTALLSRIPSQTAVDVYMGEVDHMVFARSRGLQVVDRLKGRLAVNLRPADGIVDHPLLAEQSRRWVAEELRRRLVQDMGAVLAKDAPSSDEEREPSDS